MSRGRLSSEAGSPHSGDVLLIDAAASVQFAKPMLFRVIRVHDWSTYDGWVWLDGYQLAASGEAVERRSILSSAPGCGGRAGCRGSGRAVLASSVGLEVWGGVVSMTRRSPGLHVLVEEAECVARVMDTTAAARLLHEHLTGLDPATAEPDIDLVEAAMLYAHGVDLTADDEGLDLAWARYAHRATLWLHGPWHDQTVRAGELLAWLLSVARATLRQP